MNNDLDERRKLQQFFAEVHAGEIPPPFGKLIRRRRRHQPVVWKWATATALALALLGGWALREIVWKSGLDALPPSSGDLALARSLSELETPLDFLLQTPGSELLGAPPRLTGDWLRLPQLESSNSPERKGNI